MNTHNGLCHCGCLLPAPIAKSSDATRGFVRGQPHKWRAGHHARGEHASWRDWWVETPGPLATPCWIWQLAVETQGYGIIVWEGRTWKAHRWVPWMLTGVEPPKMRDHLCRVRPCVNPDHLEPVTHRENVLRGVGPTAQNAAKTHCKHGHPLDGDNLYVRPDGGRDCRTCINTRSREARRRERAALYVDPNRPPPKTKAAAAQRKRWERERGHDPI